MLEMVGNIIRRNKGRAQWEMMMEYERVIQQREEVDRASALRNQ